MTFRAVLGALAIVGTLAAQPVPAHADRQNCDIGPASSSRMCDTPLDCTTRSQCFTGPGTDDHTCQAITVGSVTTRECIPQCSTMFACGGNDQCPVMNGIAGTCSPTITSPQICIWTTTSTSVPAYQQISYCAGGGHISDSNIGACHRLPRSSPSVYTPDYFQGDCDDDGCPNGFDTNPCHADDGACTPAMGERAESPWCAPLPALACDVSTAGVIMCGDARPCTVGATSPLPCGFGACEAEWSDVPRCRPPCSDFFLCAVGASYPEQCPQLNGQPGTCVPLPAAIPAPPLRDGYCTYSDFTDASCAGTTLTPSCFQPPGMTRLTDDFFAGDCDRDGAPNGCDDAICMAGGGTSTCRPEPGPGCTPSYTPPPDAGPGPDAGSDAGDDAGEDADTGADAGQEPGTDGGSNVTPTDTGSGGMDAGASGGPVASFAGGGGCRCAVGSRQAPLGSIVLALALGIVIAQRRRAR